MNPVNFEVFLENPDVQDLIETTKAKVKIDTGSDDYASLKAGNGIISGLTPGKYYRLEEYDGTDLKRNLFVKANGENTATLNDVGLLKGNQILNLTNNYTYKVKAAKPFADGIYGYFAFGDTSVKNANVTSGAVTIAGSGSLYLDLAPVVDAGNNYEVMMVPKTGTWGDFSRTSAYYDSTSPANLLIIADTSYKKYVATKQTGIYQYRTAGVTTGGITLQNRSIIELPGVGTQSDYVFAEYTDGKVTSFTVLKVGRKDVFDVTIVISLGFSSSTYIPTFNQSVGSFNQSDGTFNITITLTNPDSYNSITWYKDNTVLGSGVSLPLNLAFSVSADDGWWQAGDHYIYVELVDTAGVASPQSGVIKITCNPI